MSGRGSGGLAVSLIVLSLTALLPPPATGPAPSSFIFTAAGDHATGGDFAASLSRLGVSGSDFYLALGDLRYGASSEQAWCGVFKASFNDIEILAGNHETGEDPSDGNIDKFEQYCPYTLSPPPTGVYGEEYVFDYPASAPLARFILLSPGIAFKGRQYWSYSTGDAHYAFARDAIDGARAAGIPWVIVGMHKICIAAHTYGCEIGTDLWNLLLDRKVDLVLQGHAHTYQRTHQLALDPASCAAMATDTYNPACVKDDGGDGLYYKGRGSVAVIDGNFGAALYPVEPDDPEAPYFATLMGTNTSGYGWGFTRYTITADRLDAQTDFSGAYQDSFSIVSAPAPPSPTAVDARLTNSARDVAVQWTPAFPETLVDHYEVWRGVTYSPQHLGYTKVSPDLPLGTISWNDVGGGDAATSFFYSVRSVIWTGLAADSPGQAAKLYRSLPAAGPYLVSFPLLSSSDKTADRLQGVMSWSIARTYVTADARDPWKSSVLGRPAGDLRTVSSAEGVWVTVTAAGDLRMAGRVPCSVSVALVPGWNLVAYGGMGPTTTATAMAGMSPPYVEGYDAATGPYHLRRLSSASSLEPATAYWIRSGSAQTWTVTNDPSPACQ